MIVEEEVYLEHYGKKGMRWGDRNEEKPSGDNKAAGFLQTKFNTLKSQHQVREEKRSVKDAEAKRQGKMSSNQKRALIGAGVAAAALTAYGGYQLVQSGTMNSMMMKGSAFLKGEQSIFKIDKDLARKDLDAFDIMKIAEKVNPGYDNDRFGTKMNCRRASYAFEMRRRGYDVVATRTTNSRGQEMTGVLNAISPGERLAPRTRAGLASKIFMENRRNDGGDFGSSLSQLGEFGRNKIHPDENGSLSSSIFEAIGRQPNGSRGEVALSWKAGGGHSVSYEVVKGVPHIFDAQTGGAYGGLENFKKDFGTNLIGKASYTRLDNLDLNEDFLSRWVRNA